MAELHKQLDVLEGLIVGPYAAGEELPPSLVVGLQLFLQGDESARSRLLQRPGIASRFESEGVQLLPEEMQR